MWQHIATAASVVGHPLLACSSHSECWPKAIKASAGGAAAAACAKLDRPVLDTGAGWHYCTASEIPRQGLLPGYVAQKQREAAVAERLVMVASH